MSHSCRQFPHFMYFRRDESIPAVRRLRPSLPMLPMSSLYLIRTWPRTWQNGQIIAAVPVGAVCELPPELKSLWDEPVREIGSIISLHCEQNLTVTTESPMTVLPGRKSIPAHSGQRAGTAGSSDHESAFDFFDDFFDTSRVSGDGMGFVCSVHASPPHQRSCWLFSGSGYQPAIGKEFTLRVYIATQINAPIRNMCDILVVLFAYGKSESTCRLVCRSE